MGTPAYNTEFDLSGAAGAHLLVDYSQRGVSSVNRYGACHRSQSENKIKGIYRSLIVIPWALPAVIIGLTWHTEFNTQYGFVNQLLKTIGIAPVNWLQDPSAAFIAVLFVNIWLGIPFYMVMLLGGLQSISPEYYEAAQMDGADAWQRFRSITIPL